MSEIIGSLKMKGEENQISPTFKKREFVLTDNNDMYPQHILFQLTQDKCALLDQFNEGDQVKVQFNIRGREWTSPQGEVKYFNTLEAWRMEKAAVGMGAPSTPSPMDLPVSQSASVIENVANTSEDEDDLPF
jgi:hypothetical protein